MKISMVIYGTRGDVQPMVALALGLQKAGHEVLLYAPLENEELVKQYGVNFHAVGTSVKAQFDKAVNKKSSPKTQPSPKFMKQEISNQLNELPALLKGSDLILGVGLIFGVPTVAELLGIPWRFVCFYPGILGTSKYDPLPNRMMFGFGRIAMNTVLKGFINKKRKELGLHPIKDVWEYWMGPCAIVAAYPALGAVNEGLNFPSVQTGFMLLPPKTQLDETIEAFFSTGPRPVFVGFGSNPVNDQEKLSRILLDTAATVKQRFIISKGWGGMNEMAGRPDCLFIDNVPYELLFPRVAMVVHHGGIGTTTIAAVAGVPQVITPFMADQFQNRDRLVKLGVGPKTKNFKSLTVKALSTAINECLSNDQYRKKAESIANQIKGIDGTALTLKAIEAVLKK